MVDVCLLGCGGMMPLPDRRLTALLFRCGGKMLLIDCGEGTQVSVKMTGWGFKAIEAILLTHYHADHIAGLPGLLSTIGNSGREEPLTLFGPPGLRQVVAGLTVIVPALPFDILLAELPPDCLSVGHVGDIHVSCMPVEHTTPCFAYCLELKRAGRFDVEKAQSLAVPKAFWKRLQNGETVEYKGGRYTPDMVLGKERKGIKVAYCTDTRPTEGLVNFCRDADLFICEGMYGEDEKLPDAALKKHMTFSEAAGLAKKSGSKELWLTHFSPSVKDPELYLENAAKIFENSVAGRDLMMKTLHFE